jgi:hypothetical protein
MATNLKSASPADLDCDLRLYIYRHFTRQGQSPTVAEMAKRLSCSIPQIRSALRRLAETHAFVLQDSGELWRAAPFSAVPTAFPVQVRKRSYYSNCIWDALGVAAMLQEDARVAASCACCNFAMALNVKDGKLVEKKGVVHFAVPARHWYQDIVFT